MTTQTPSTNLGHQRAREGGAGGVNWIKAAVFVGLAVGAVLFARTYSAGAATAPSLGTAASFGVLGGSTVTNTGPTTVNGNVGVSPGSAITGTGSMTLTGGGTLHPPGTGAPAARADTLTAFNALTAEGCTATNTSLAGPTTLTPGVYCYTSSASLSGTVTLNGAGVYIFKTVSTLTTATGSTVALTGGALACNVFWQIGSSADLFTNTTFVGNILALASINLQNGTSLAGRALAGSAGAVTMDTNTISPTTCDAGTTPTNTTVPGATATPKPIGVGGIADVHVNGDPGSGAADAGSGGWGTGHAMAISLATAAALSMAAGGWYVRRRLRR